VTLQITCSWDKYGSAACGCEALTRANNSTPPSRHRTRGCTTDAEIADGDTAAPAEELTDDVPEGVEFASRVAQQTVQTLTEFVPNPKFRGSTVLDGLQQCFLLQTASPQTLQ